MGFKFYAAAKRVLAEFEEPSEGMCKSPRIHSE